MLTLQSGDPPPPSSRVRGGMLLIVPVLWVGQAEPPAVCVWGGGAGGARNGFTDPMGRSVVTILQPSRLVSPFSPPPVALLRS